MYCTVRVRVVCTCARRAQLVPTLLELEAGQAAGVVLDIDSSSSSDQNVYPDVDPESHQWTSRTSSPAVAETDSAQPSPCTAVAPDLGKCH